MSLLPPVTILHVVGARPNFMKIAPLMRALTRRGGARQILVHTGQHYDDQMSARVFNDLELPCPDVNLGVGSGTHAVQTAEVMRAFEPVLEREKPSLVVVVGDVNSTLACALVAAKLNVPVAHVEAGLRSGDRTMPEEINRILTDQLAELLLTPGPDADANLLREGIAADRIHCVGNIMIDTLIARRDQARSVSVVDIPGLCGLARGRAMNPGEYVYVTLHRPSNVDNPHVLAEIYDALSALAVDVPVVFPMHPRTRKNSERFGLFGRLGQTIVLEPLSYLHSLKLMDGAGVVLTDSGGIQEETTVLAVPCVTLRTTTERPVTITEGTNVLVPDRTKANVLAAVQEARRKQGRIPDKWDGKTAERIADVLAAWFGGAR